MERILSQSRWLLLGSCLIAAILLAPTLFGGKVFRGDATDIVIPQLAFYKYSFAAGQSPFWNPYLAVGFPNFISVGGHPFSPLNLFLVFSPVSAHYWSLFVLIAVTLFFAISFLKKLGISGFGSAFGGLAYLIASLWYLQNSVIITTIFVQAVLFWSFLGATQAIARKSFWLYSLTGAGIFGYGWLMSGYWSNLYVFFALLAFAFYLNVSWKKIIIFFLTIGLLGAAIGVFQIVPTYVMSQFSARSGGLDTGAAEGYAISFRELVNFVHLTPRRGLDAYLYFGIAPLIFFLFSFWGKRNHLNYFRWLFFIALVLSVKGSPLFWLVSKLPLFNLFEGAARFMLLGGFAAAVLAGSGFDLVEQKIKDGGRRSVRKTVDILCGLVFLAILLVPLISTEKGAVYLALASLVFLTIVWILISNRHSNTPILLLLLVGLDLIFVSYSFNWRNITNRSIYEQTPIAQEVLTERPGRILPLFVEDWDDTYFYKVSRKPAPHWADAPYATELLLETYNPNFQLLHQIENLEANEPLLNTPMARLMALLGTRQLANAGGEEKLDKVRFSKIIGSDEEAKSYNNDFSTGQDVDISVVKKFLILKERLGLLNFLGIKYTLSAYELAESEAKITTLIPKFYVPLDIMGIPDVQPMPMIVYENPNAKPIAYFSEVSGYTADPGEIYRSFKAGGFKDIFVECSDCPANNFTTQGRIGLIKKENGYAQFLTESSSEQFLIFTQNYLPGWHAYIDGKEVEMLKVNTVFPGVFVPAGEHKVEFRYSYWSLFNPKLIFGNVK